MDQRRSRFRVGRHLTVVMGLLLAGCTTSIAPSVQSNPPPTEPLAHFTQFQLMPLEASTAAKEEKDALAMIETNLKQHVQPLIGSWNKQSGTDRALQIRPYVRELKFVGGGTRFFAGALAGSSAVVMTVKLVDRQTKTVVAEPQFYQRASAMGGAWSIGATDNDMLNRIAVVCQEYLERNYNRAVGGPTGLEETDE